MAQHQPDPATPVHERRWLDRLRAAWSDLRASPTSKEKATALESVANERPEEAGYRMGTFAADADRTSPRPATPEEERGQRELDEAEGARGQSTPDSDRFSDEAGQ